MTKQTNGIIGNRM